MKRRHFFLLGLLCTTFCFPLPGETPFSIPVGHPQLLYSGRRDGSKPGEIRFGYSGARIRLAFRGSSIAMRMDSAKSNWVNVYIDGQRLSKILISGEGNLYPLASGLSDSPHTVEIVRATECITGPTVFKGFELPEGAQVLEWPEKDALRIEFIGDSITCGYGIEVNDPKLHFNPETENFCDTYAWLAARSLKADFLVVARSGIGMLRNYNGPEDGSPDNMPNLYDATFYGVEKPLWDFSRFRPDVVCINLGTNDFSTKGVNREKFEASYLAFVERLISRYPGARIVLLQGPMQNGAELQGILMRIVETLNRGAEKNLSYFQLSAQGAHGHGADWHPSQKQAKINGAELAACLSKLMQVPAVPAESVAAP